MAFIAPLLGGLGGAGAAAGAAEAAGGAAAAGGGGAGAAGMLGRLGNFKQGMNLAGGIGDMVQTVKDHSPVMSAIKGVKGAIDAAASASGTWHSGSDYRNPF